MMVKGRGRTNSFQDLCKFWHDTGQVLCRIFESTRENCPSIAECKIYLFEYRSLIQQVLCQGFSIGATLRITESVRFAARCMKPIFTNLKLATLRVVQIARSTENTLLFLTNALPKKQRDSLCTHCVRYLLRLNSQILRTRISF